MKRIIFFAMALSGMTAFAQTTEELKGRFGINTDKPRATLDIVGRLITDTDKTFPRGVILPHISNAEKADFEDKTPGLMIWNKTDKCVDVWDGTKWQCFGGTQSTSTPILAPVIPPGITLGSGSHFIASIYDEDYLPYTTPTSAAVWTAVVADGTQEAKIIDVQGTIPATGISVQIPITATGNATLSAFTSPEIAINAQGEQGVANSTRKVILSWTQQDITSATKFITATIKPANNQVLNVKKLDLNGGLGNDYKGLMLANFSLPKSNLNTTERVSYELRVISGMPDRNFANMTGGEYKYQFLYIPIEVTGTNGYKKTWLNNNLGAEYAKVGSASFNPAQQATAYNDYEAYGSLFQWQRPADGHELVTWTSTTTGTITPTTSTISSNADWTAGHSNFILANPSSYWSWVNSTINENSTNKNLWQSGGANNPCPVGYHVPTSTEWNEFHGAFGGSQGYSTWLGTNALRLPAAGWRHSDDGALGNQGSYGYYWSSEALSSNDSWYFYFRSSGNGTGRFGSPAGGFAVRCIKD